MAWPCPLPPPPVSEPLGDTEGGSVAPIIRGARGPEPAPDKRGEGATSQGRPQPGSWGAASVVWWRPKPGERL